MFAISQYFYGSSTDEKNNMYKDIIIDILIKRRNKLFTVYGILNMYSLSSKKKMDDIMNNKNEILEAINQIKNDENVIYYYYCKGDKLYYLFEYSITPTIRNVRNNIDVLINDNIDGCFALNIDIDTIKNVLVESKKYVNFCPKNLSINGQNILKQLIISNEEKTLENIIEKYNVNITDNESGCGMKYNDLLNLALSINNGNIVNIINKCYYEKKYEKMNKMNKIDKMIEIPQIESPYQKYYDYLKIGSRISCTLSLPFVLYIMTYGLYC
jgi:hypothetical protein